MTVRTQIFDGGGTNNRTRVTTIGQLVTAPYAYDQTQYVELAEADTAYNFYGPRNGEQFVITGFIAKADKQVSTTADADVVIYEATASDTTTVSKVLFQTVMVEGDLLAAIPLNIVVTTGVYVNAKTTDDDIHITIMGYYIPKLES